MSDTKIVLKHKAEVVGVVPVIKTKLSLEAVVGTYRNDRNTEWHGVKLPLHSYSVSES